MNLCKLKIAPSYLNSSTPSNEVVLKWLFIDLLQIRVLCVTRLCAFPPEASGTSDEPSTVSAIDTGCPLALVLFMHSCGRRWRGGQRLSLLRPTMPCLCPPHKRQHLSLSISWTDTDDTDEWWEDEIKSNKQQERDRRIKPRLQTREAEKRISDYSGPNEFFKHLPQLIC